MTGFGEINDTCVLLMTMNHKLNKELADEIVKMPGFDESIRKEIDFDGLEVLEEEEIHFAMLRETKEITGNSSSHEEMHFELDRMQNYMRDNYPDTHTVGYKVLYGKNETPYQRLDRYVESTGSDFLMLHKEQVKSVDEFASKISKPIVVIG